MQAKRATTQSGHLLDISYEEVRDGRMGLAFSESYGRIP
jgi:hypothetical protein